MDFTIEQTEEIEQLSGLNYTINQIAMYLDLSPEDLQAEFENPESDFRYHFDRGRLISQAKIDMQTQKSAEGGSLSAAQTLENIRRSRHFENLRNQMLYGH